jgi:hypothetical protein
MKKLKCFCALLLWACSFICISSQGFSKQLSIGYAFPAHESDQHYDHSGLYINGAFYHYLLADHMLLFTLNGAMGYWHADTTDNNHLLTLAVLPTFRAYFSQHTSHIVRPYLFLGYGPAYLSHRTFGEKTQGTHLAFQGDVGAGIEFGKHYKGLDINGRFTHFSNAGLFHPNQGFDFLFILSVGYLWA